MKMCNHLHLGTLILLKMQKYCSPWNWMSCSVFILLNKCCSRLRESKPVILHKQWTCSVHICQRQPCTCSCFRGIFEHLKSWHMENKCPDECANNLYKQANPLFSFRGFLTWFVLADWTEAHHFFSSFMPIKWKKKKRIILLYFFVPFLFLI